MRLRTPKIDNLRGKGKNKDTINKQIDFISRFPFPFDINLVYHTMRNHAVLSPSNVVRKTVSFTDDLSRLPSNDPRPVSSDVFAVQFLIAGGRD